MDGNDLGASQDDGPDRCLESDDLGGVERGIRVSPEQLGQPGLVPAMIAYAATPPWGSAGLCGRVDLDQAEKLAPQVQKPVAFGLLKTKPRSVIPSLNCTVVPLRYR